MTTTSTTEQSRVAVLEDKAVEQLRRLPALSDLDDIVGDPYFLACAMVTDAWQPALASSYQLGYENGFRLGYAQCEADEAARWSRLYRNTAAVLAQPTHAELKRRRGEA